MTRVVPPDASSTRRDESQASESENKRLLDEYKIIQDKIDKIGAFKFTIKGWSVTVFIAALAAGKATDVPIFVITLGLAGMLAYFFFLEFQQVKISRILGGRARKLEMRFRVVNDGRSRSIAFSSPYIAHEIALARHDAKRGKMGSDRWKIARQADVFFYIMLITLALALSVFVKETPPKAIQPHPTPKLLSQTSAWKHFH